MDELIIEVASRPDGVAVVCLAGLADLAGSQALDQRLLSLSAQRPARVVFDLSKLKGMSSICMGNLVRFRHGIARHGGSVVFAGANGLVLMAIQRAKLDQIFKLFGTVDEALAKVEPEQPA
jgi:anti-anti-sigma factor